MCHWCVTDFVWALFMQSNAKPSFFPHLSVTSSLENFHSRYKNELCPFGHHLVCHVIGTQELKELVFSVTKPSMNRRHHPVPAATASL